MRNVSRVLFLTAFIGRFYWFIGRSNEFPSEKISEVTGCIASWNVNIVVFIPRDKFSEI